MECSTQIPRLSPSCWDYRLMMALSFVLLWKLLTQDCISSQGLANDFENTKFQSLSQFGTTLRGLMELEDFPMSLMRPQLQLYFSQLVPLPPAASLTSLGVYLEVYLPRAHPSEHFELNTLSSESSI